LSTTGNGVPTIFHTKQVVEREIGTFVLFYEAWHSSPLFLSQTMANRFHRMPTNFHILTRVNSTNILDEGLRIGGIGHWMNSNINISQTRRVLRINVVVNLAYSHSVPDRPHLAPIYIGGQVSRNQSGPIHITISIYDMDSYFDYDYTWA
jgi:hypothetical protein